MLKRLKAIFKTQDEKKLESATENFDELMGKVDEDQKDLTRLEHHMREEWDKINGDMAQMKEGVDEVVSNKAV